MAEFEQEEKQDGLKELQLMLNTMFDNSSDYILTVNQGKMVMFYNRCLPEKEFKKTFNVQLDDYFPDESKADISATVDAVFKNGTTKRIKITNKKDEDKRIYVARIAPVKDQIRILAVIITLEDVTKLVSLQEENQAIKAKMKHLQVAKIQQIKSNRDEEKVKKITQELDAANAQLQTAQMQINQLSQENTAFLEEIGQLKAKIEVDDKEIESAHSLEKSLEEKLGQVKSHFQEVEEEVTKAKREERKELEADLYALNEIKSMIQTRQQKMKSSGDEDEVKALNQIDEILNARVEHVKKELEDIKDPAGIDRWINSIVNITRRK